VVLERVERRPARLVYRDDLTIDHRLVREVLQSLGDRGVPQGEVFVISGAQVYLAAALEPYGTVAVEASIRNPTRRLRARNYSPTAAWVQKNGALVFLPVTTARSHAFGPALAKYRLGCIGSPLHIVFVAARKQ
jgi:hypothetical protein